MDIKFSPVGQELEGLFDPPVKSLSITPNWYKDMHSYTKDHHYFSEDGDINSTIKKCMPVFDAMTAGYTLLSQADVMFTDGKEV